MTIGEWLKIRPLKGLHFGYELEVEGTELPGFVDGFHVVREGSLRPVDGEDGKEYVFDEPKNYVDTIKHISALSKAVEKGNPEFSHRTSVHVHLNVQDMKYEHYFNMLFLWMMFEPQLLAFCGDARQSNLFCLSSRDAEGLMFALERVAQTKSINLLNDDIRYSAVNLAATAKYGTVEFRAMRGTIDCAVIFPWIDALKCLYTAAQKFDTPKELWEFAYEAGYSEMYNYVFGKLQGFKNLCHEGQRLYMETLFRLSLIADSVNWAAVVFIDEPDDDI